MTPSRREFLVAGVGAAAAGSLGCNRSLEVQFPAFVGDGELDSPFRSPNSGAINLVSHFLNRLSYGPRPEDYGRVLEMGMDPEERVQAYVEEQLNPDGIGDNQARRALRRFETLDDPVGELFEYKQKFLLEEMTRATLLSAVMSRRQLFEVMVGFWTDHFNIDPSKGDCKWLKAADDRQVIREHALGKFPDLLRASALSPAMLWYLDGRVNRTDSGEDSPNENYARELLELHTLGVHGGYSQKDVMEVARCLSGWNVREKGQFWKGEVEFHPEWHDDGEKIVLGEKIPRGLGEKDLDRVLDIVSLHPSTADYIAWKLCRRFIDETPPESAVSNVSHTFVQSKGDVRSTLRTLFSTQEFRNARGTKFKRPFRFIVSALRATRAQTNAPKELIEYLVRMGHGPFQYPTPDGYPEESSPWMGTLLWRWNFAVALIENHIQGTKVDSSRLVKGFGGDEKLMAHLLGRTPTQGEVESYHDSGSGVALALASPGFQRC